MPQFVPAATHLKLNQRKALAARIAAAQHLSFADLPACSAESQLEFTRLVRLIINPADDADETNHDGVRLDAFVWRIAQNVAEFSISDRDPASDELNRRKDLFASHLRALNCTSCVVAQDVCSDGDLDDGLVSKGGRCIEPFREMERSIETEVAALYRANGLSGVRTQVVFSTQTMPSGPGVGLLDRFHVVGETDVADDQEPISIVTLTVKRRAFDWASLCQVPYVLFHELTCHAYQGLLPPPGGPAGSKPQRKNADEMCSWSEGWMDRIAVRLALAWIRKPVARAWFQHREDAARVQIEELHRARFGASPSLKGLALVHRNSAVAAFDQLFRALCGWRETPSAARAMVDFSLALNLFDISPQSPELTWRVRLIALLEVRLCVPGSSTYDDAVAACRTFTFDRDLTNLLNALA